MRHEFISKDPILLSFIPKLFETSTKILLKVSALTTIDSFLLTLHKILEGKLSVASLLSFLFFDNSQMICQGMFKFLRSVFHPRTTPQAAIIPDRILTVMKISLHFFPVSYFANCFKTSMTISYVHELVFSWFKFSIHE